MNCNSMLCRGALVLGRDLAPLYLAGAKPAWRSEFFYEFGVARDKPAAVDAVAIPASEALVRKDLKYIYWPQFHQEQLFDLTTDPLELQDLIADPARNSQLAAMRTRIAELRAKAK